MAQIKHKEQLRICSLLSWHEWSNVTVSRFENCQVASCSPVQAHLRIVIVSIVFIIETMHLVSRIESGFGILLLGFGPVASVLQGTTSFRETVVSRPFLVRINACYGVA